MSASFGHDSNCKGGPATVCPVADSASYEAVSAEGAAAQVSAAISAMPATLRRIDIDPIRWGWWFAALGMSGALWACIAIGMF